MRDAPQFTEEKDRDFLVDFKVIEENHTASWQLNDRGYAAFEIQMHKAAGWLSLSLTESSEKSRRETMLTLTPESGRKMYEFLKAHYEPVFTPADDEAGRKAEVAARAEMRAAQGHN